MVQKDRGFFHVTLLGKAMKRGDAQPTGQVGIHAALKEKLGQLSRCGDHRHALGEARPMPQHQTNDRLVAAFSGGRESVRIVGQRGICGQDRCRGVEIAVGDEDPERPYETGGRDLLI